MCFILFSLSFVITKETYYPQQGNLRVYIRPVATGIVQPLVSFTKVVSTISDFSLVATTLISTNDPRGFILTYACAVGDKVTAVWEEHNDIVSPPYPFWAGQGW